MAPSIGRTVIYVTPASTGPVSGAREHPAVITRVWSEICVNLMVFFDAGSAAPRTSVLAYNAASDQDGGWKWPERVA